MRGGRRWASSMMMSLSSPCLSRWVLWCCNYAAQGHVGRDSVQHLRVRKHCASSFARLALHTTIYSLLHPLAKLPCPPLPALYRYQPATMSATVATAG